MSTKLQEKRPPRHRPNRTWSCRTFRCCSPAVWTEARSVTPSLMMTDCETLNELSAACCRMQPPYVFLSASSSFYQKCQLHTFRVYIVLKWLLWSFNSFSLSFLFLTVWIPNWADLKYLVLVKPSDWDKLLVESWYFCRCGFSGRFLLVSTLTLDLLFTCVCDVWGFGACGGGNQNCADADFLKGGRRRKGGSG